MPFSTLGRGALGEDVARLQSGLNKVGAMLVPDGDFGAGTERGVLYAQDMAGHSANGVADSQLWDWLEAQPSPFDKLQTDGIAFIAREETGGLGYYNKVTRWPHFPGHESGITIGVGYDLRFNVEAEFRAAWGGVLPAAHVDELALDIGKMGSSARVGELKSKGISVPFRSAWPVLTGLTLPSFYDQSESIYPSLSRLPDLCRSALVSLVYNRGASLSGSRRKEMKAIQEILASADDDTLSEDAKRVRLLEVEDQIVSMKRLWAASSGLIKRRQAEANLWREGIKARFG